MSTADKFQKYLTSIADSIRTKEGSTDKIKPIDFPQRIEGLEVGGASSGAVDNWMYLKLNDGWYDANSGGTRIMVAGFAQVVHIDDGGENNNIFSAGVYGIVDHFAYTKKIAFDKTIKAKIQGDTPMSWDELIAASGVSEEEALGALSATRISKEQFYDLSN